MSRKVTEQDLTKPQVNSGFQQWKFVHGLLKEMVLNAIVSMNYLRLAPSNVKYYNCADDIKKKELKKFYVAFMKSFDATKDKYGVMSNTREETIKRAFQMVMTIADNDHVYGGMAQQFIENLQTINDIDVEEYARNEKLLGHIQPQNFVMKENEVGEHG
jgi:hypothetical protein